MEMSFPRWVVAALLAAGCFWALPAAAGDDSALGALKRLAGDDAVQASVVSPVARKVVVDRDLGPAAKDSSDFPEPVTLSRSILSVAPTDDADRDGLSDAGEAELADAFRPFMVFDSRENSRRPNEPVVAFQARPLGCAGARAHCHGAPLTVQVLYNTLWRQDGGYVDSFFCNDSHKGDIALVTVTAESYDDGRTFRMSSVENWGYTWPKKSGPVRFLAGTHPWIYFSGGKHHQYFDTASNGKPSPYSAWSCREAMDDKGDFKLAELAGNVGEPESHPSGRFVNDLSPYGYPGESVWDQRHFCGGQACNRDTNPGSRLAETWLRSPFFVP
jgi:hypothetical protein